MVTDAKPRKSEVRAAAYNICARAMLGEEQTVSDEAVEAAVLIVANDCRKNRTAAERSVGMWVAGVLVVGVFTDPATLERLTFGTALDGLGGLLGDALGAAERGGAPS